MLKQLKAKRTRLRNALKAYFQRPQSKRSYKAFCKVVDKLDKTRSDITCVGFISYEE